MRWLWNVEQLSFEHNGVTTTYLKIEPRLWPRVALVVAIVLFVATFAYAAPTKSQRAAALVTVVNALIEVADQNPILPDKPPRYAATEDLFSGEGEQSGNSGELPDDQPWSVMICDAVGCDLRKAANVDGESLLVKDADLDIERAKRATITIVHGDKRWPGKFVSDDHGAWFQVAGESDLRSESEADLARETVAESTPEAASVGPVRIEFSQPTAIVDERIEVTVHTHDNCGPCRKMKADNGDGDERIRFVYTTDPGPVQNIPCCVWTGANGKQWYVVGYHTTDQVWERIQRNDPPMVRNVSMASSGYAGAIHASSQIREAINSWRNCIGENVKVTATWDRTGGQSITLLSRSEWTTRNLFGNYGRFRVSAAGALNLPTDELGFTYSVLNDDITIDAEPTKLRGLAKLLGPQRAEPVSAGDPCTSFASPVPSGISPTVILSIVSAAWQLAHPHADVLIPGNVSMTAELIDSKLVIDFTQGPRVRIKILFEFELGIKQIVIQETNVHVEFTGSRFVKSRDFEVK